MITQIEDAIVALLKVKLTASTAGISVQKGFEGLPVPAVYVSTEAGRFEKITQSTFREHLTIYVDILFLQLSDERERRKGIYLIMDGILQTLLLQDLGLSIKPLMPESWRNTTHEEFRKKGLMAFSLEVATSYTITKQDDETVTDLLAVGLNYYLEPGDQLAASDTVTLSE